ncbi:MAG: hypothetical protein O3A80_03275 [bacterium]|nr:hypothetical protein [bacterium]
MKKKLLPLLAFAIVVSAALLPISVVAASYNPGYTCYYRDIAGSCLSYQVQNPHFFNNYSVGGTTRSVYGNRQTYPFRAMFNAQSTTQNTWDNRTNNKKNFQRVFQYEEDDDDEDKGNWPADRSLGGGWRWYFDEDDDTYNRYRYQNDDYYEDDDDNDYYDEDEDRYWDDNDKDFYEEYERTRYYNSNYIRY